MLRSRIGFSTTNHLLSRVVRFVTRSNCSHVFFVYYDQDFCLDMVMEAHWSYRLIPLDQFTKTNKIIRIITPKHDIDLAIKSSVHWLGSLYDAKGLVGMAWVKLGRWLRHCWKNPFRSTANVYCSEAVTRGLLDQRYPGFNSMDAETVGPDDLLEFFITESAKTT